MANELNIAYTAGQAMEAEVYADNWVQQGSSVVMTEVSAGKYSADMPGSTPAGCYGVLFINTTPATDVNVGRGGIEWDGAEEVCGVDVSDKVKELWQYRGLDPDFDATYRNDKVFVGAEGAPEIEVILTGDGVSEKVANRTP